MGNLQKTNFKSVTAEQLIEEMNLGVVFANPEGVIQTYNTAAERILGIKRREILHKKWEDTPLPFSIREGLLQVKTEKNRELEVEISSLNKEGWLIAIRDVTADRKREIIAKRRSRMEDLAEMASMVSHEIRNPLGGIKGFASLLEKDLKEHPSLQKMASHIVKGTDGLNDIVSRVVDYSRPLPTEPKPADLVKVIKELQQQIEFDLIVQESAINLLLHESAFKTAFMNLLENAREATPNGGKIKVKIDIEDDEVILRLSDTGCGIAEENLKRVFTPFFTTRTGGKGFGLPVAHKIVQEHDGGIEVESMINKGTTFTIKLPYRKV